MSIRAAIAADCPALAAIDAAGNPSPWSAGQFEAAITHAADTVLVAENGGGICGFIVWQTLFDESELHLIAVSPEHHRQGIASTLLAAWFQTALSQNTARLLLEVRAGNPAAQALYRKHGFQECGRRKGYYPLPDGAREDAVLMEKPC